MADLLEQIKKVFSYSGVRSTGWYDTVIFVNLFPIRGVKAFKPPDIKKEIEYHYSQHELAPIGYTEKEYEPMSGSLTLYESDWITLKTLSDGGVGQKIIIAEKVGNLIQEGLETGNIVDMDAIRVWTNVLIVSDDTPERKIGDSTYEHKIGLEFLSEPFQIEVSSVI
jgi:hypothetical protein